MMNNEKSACQDESDEPSQLSLPVLTVEQEIGARLRHQRLARNLSIAQVSTALKLAGSTIEGIERGEPSRHPGPYRRGHIGSYARFLGLDPAILLDLLEQTEPTPLQPVMPSSARVPRLERLLKIATYSVVTTAIIPPLVWIYIQGGLDFIGGDRAALLDNDPAPTMAPALLAQRPAAAPEHRDAGARAALTASALPLSPIRPVRDAMAEDAMEAVSGTPEPQDPRSVLVVEVLDDSWLEVYAADGQRLEFDLLRAGDQRRFVAEAPFRVLAGRGSAINLMLDGEALAFEGQDRGDVVNLELSAAGAVRR